MLLAAVGYIILLTLVGLFSLGLFGRGRILPYFIAVTIGGGSLWTLGYILWHFQELAWKTPLLRLAWPLPFAAFSVALDSLTLFFTVPLLILVAAGAFYGSHYGGERQPFLTHWLYYALLSAGMMLVLLAGNAILFIMAWELVSLAAFFLIIGEGGDAEASRAGRSYLIAAHIGTFFLLLAILLLALPVKSFEFSAFAMAAYSPLQLNLIFSFVLLGCAFKGGLFPAYSWLPATVSAAPAHGAALLAGIMPKLALYGIVRLLLLLHGWQLWWGVLLLIAGAAAGVIGPFLAFGESDIRRLLGCHSIQNSGIMVLGLGIAVLGMACHNVLVAILGFAGVLIHLFSHALINGLLFLATGAVVRQTGLTEVNRYGGLVRRMPGTAWLFLSGAAAISGLPFFSGFIGELFIYAAAIIAVVEGNGLLLPLLTAAAVITLSFIGALTLASFSGLFGTVFLGNSREESVANARPAPPLLLAGMTLPAMFIIFIGLCGIAVVPFAVTPVRQFIGGAEITVVTPLLRISENLSLAVAAALVALLLLLAGRLLLFKNALAFRENWQGGYTLPEPKSMQYTASSFFQLFSSLCRKLSGLRQQADFTAEFFPRDEWSFSSRRARPLAGIISVFAALFTRLAALLRRAQGNEGSSYLLYTAITLVLLIIWSFWAWK